VVTGVVPRELKTRGKLEINSDGNRISIPVASVVCRLHVVRILALALKQKMIRDLKLVKLMFCSLLDQINAEAYELTL
jgi:hypothetical protein